LVEEFLEGAPSETAATDRIRITLRDKERKGLG
jgi:hypothetical protein